MTTGATTKTTTKEGKLVVRPDGFPEAAMARRIAAVRAALYAIEGRAEAARKEADRQLLELIKGWQSEYPDAAFDLDTSGIKADISGDVIAAILEPLDATEKEGTVRRARKTQNWIAAKIDGDSLLKRLLEMGVEMKVAMEAIEAATTPGHYTDPFLRLDIVGNGKGKGS